MENCWRQTMTPKAKKFVEWASSGIELIKENQMLDEEIQAYKSMMDDFDGDFVGGCIQDVEEKKRKNISRIVGYRLALADCLRALDLDDYTPEAQSKIRMMCKLRFFRGLPLNGKGKTATVEKYMRVEHSQLFRIHRIAANEMAKHWDENTPPV